MAVLLETSKGDIVIDLYSEECPLASRNFLKLCKYACWTTPLLITTDDCFPIIFNRLFEQKNNKVVE